VHGAAAAFTAVQRERGSSHGGRHRPAGRARRRRARRHPAGSGPARSGAGRQARLRTIERTGKDPADNWFNNSINDSAARHPVGKVVVYVALVAFCVLLGLWSAFN
jgi:hypothetical protein